MPDNSKGLKLAALRAELDILKDIIAHFSASQPPVPRSVATQPLAPQPATQVVAPQEKIKITL